MTILVIQTLLVAVQVSAPNGISILTKTSVLQKMWREKAICNSSQWYENSLATEEDCSGLFRILLRVSSVWRWPFRSQDLVADEGFHLCGNRPLRRTNKMSDMLETNNLDLKSAAMIFVCENPLSASAELIGTVCSINNSAVGARLTFADFIYSLNCGMTSTTFTQNLVHRSVISLSAMVVTRLTATCCYATHQTDLTDSYCHQLQSAAAAADLQWPVETELLQSTYQPCGQSMELIWRQWFICIDSASAWLSHALGQDMSCTVCSALIMNC